MCFLREKSDIVLVFISTNTLLDVEILEGFAGLDRASAFCSKNVKKILNADTQASIPKATRASAYISVL